MIVIVIVCLIVCLIVCVTVSDCDCGCGCAGIAVDYRASITGYSALFAASQKSHTAAVDLLLKNGANPNL